MNGKKADEFVNILTEFFHENAWGGSDECLDDEDECMRIHPIHRAYTSDGVAIEALINIEGTATLLAQHLGMYHICNCWDGNYDNFDGAQPDCPIHGAVRAYNEAMRETAELHRTLFALEREKKALLAENVQLRQVAGEIG